MDCAQGNVETLNLYVFKVISSKITGWPLSEKLPQDIIQVTPENMIRKESGVKHKVLIFSPHPDDDVISMGGTIQKLQNQGH